MYEEIIAAIKAAKSSEEISLLTTRFLRESDMDPREQIELLKELNAAGSARRKELLEETLDEIDRENEISLSKIKEETAQSLERSLNFLAEELGVKR